MNVYNRRKFFKTTAPLGLMPFIRRKSFWESAPDLILYNANIITIDNAKPKAQAMAIFKDIIVNVGYDKEILRTAGAFTKKIDLGGHTVTPGFIDAHSHPAYSGRAHLRNVDCSLPSIEEIKEAIHKRALKTPEGNWVLGFKYDDTKTKEGRYITRFDLDQAAPNHPVFISHRGGHTVFVNSMALKLAGITKDTPDPEGGKIVHDTATGQLTGQLQENATNAIDKLIPNEFSRQDYQDGVKLITKMMAKTGVTSVTDADASKRDFQAFQDAYDAGDLSIRIYSMIDNFFLDDMNKAAVNTGFGDKWVRLGAIKLFCDGSISERTARLSEPYTGRPDYYGIMMNDAEALYPKAIEAHKSGWQIGTHANGDVAIENVLTLYERLQKEHPRKDPRFRIEHCTVINKDILRRMKALNVIPTPFSTYVYFHGEKMKYYGKERLENMFAVKSFLDAGIKVTQASDYPPGPFEPMMALRSQVSRTDWQGNVWGSSQKVSVAEAIKVGTINGAYASYEENIKGSLEAGKLADLVVLGKDPEKVDPLELINIPIVRTMVGGKWVYES